MKKTSFALIIIILVASCSKKFPEFSSLDESLKNNPDSLQMIIDDVLESGIFDRNIHFFSGGDSGWLDPIRDSIDNKSLDLKTVEENIKTISKAIGYNTSLIEMGVNPNWFSDQNLELGEYLADLNILRKYYSLIDSLKRK